MPIFFILSNFYQCYNIIADEVVNQNQQSGINQNVNNSFNNNNTNTDASTNNATSSINANTSTNTSTNTPANNTATSTIGVSTAAINDLIATMARAINSRDSNNIASFFHYYSTKDAVFIKKSYLYDTKPSNTDATSKTDTTTKNTTQPTTTAATTTPTQKPMAEEDLKMNLEEYIKYWYDIVKNPTDYSISISVDKVDEQNPQYATATIEIREMSTQKFDQQITNPKGSKDPVQIVKKMLKVVAYSTCNVTCIYNGTVVISGMNCIENMAYNVE